MFKPTLNQILFKPFPSYELSTSGLLIPETAREISNRGLIVEVGNGTAKRPMLLKKGTVAHRVKDWGQEVMINNELHFIMDDRAIIAIEN